MVLLEAYHNKRSFIQHNYSSIIVTMLFKLCLFVFSQVDVRLQSSKQQTKESALELSNCSCTTTNGSLNNCYARYVHHYHLILYKYVCSCYSHISGRCYLRAMTEAFYPPKVLRFWSGGSRGGGGGLRIYQ